MLTVKYLKIYIYLLFNLLPTIVFDIIYATFCHANIHSNSAISTIIATPITMATISLRD